VTGLTGCSSQQEREIFVTSTDSILAVGPKKSPNTGNVPADEAEYSIPCSTEIKNAWSHTFTYGGVFINKGIFPHIIISIIN
jgi:hypothetical protein